MTAKLKDEHYTFIYFIINFIFFFKKKLHTLQN